MKKMYAGLLAALLVLGGFVPVAQAQLSFLFGFAVGSAMNGGGHATAPALDPNLVYVMPEAATRVRSVSSVQFGATRQMMFDSVPGEYQAEYEKKKAMKTASIYKLFSMIEAKPENFEIVEIRRFISPSDPTYATFWFAYIPKELVIPLEQLKKK